MTAPMTTKPLLTVEAVAALRLYAGKVFHDPARETMLQAADLITRLAEENERLRDAGWRITSSFNGKLGFAEHLRPLANEIRMFCPQGRD